MYYIVLIFVFHPVAALAFGKPTGKIPVGTTNGILRPCFGHVSDDPCHAQEPDSRQILVSLHAITCSYSSSCERELLPVLFLVSA